MNRTWLTILLLCFALPSANALVILQYHHIDDSTPFSTSTAPERFKAHLNLLNELGATIVRLEENYRSTGHILAAASGLIARNESRLGKTLYTGAGDGEKLRVNGYWDGADEARAVL